MPKGIFVRKKKSKQVRRSMFWQKVTVGKEDDCWEWKQHKSEGYPSFWTGIKHDGAHRYSLELKLGRPLVEGECALHTCDNKKCVNPKHLFAGTNDDNSKDMVRKGRKEKGADVNCAVLTDQKVERMRWMFSTGQYSLKEIGDFFDVCSETAWHALRGYTWKHVDGPLLTERLSTANKGTANGNAVLNPEKVRFIRANKGKMTSPQLAKIVKCSPEAVIDVWKRRTWKHIT